MKKMSHSTALISLISATFIVLAGMMLVGCAATTPLMQAAGRGDLNVATTLINSGVEINEKGGFGMTGLTSYMTALSLASWNGHVDVVRLLIDKGANVNMEGNQFNMPALSLASWKGHADVAKLLIDNGADVDRALAACEETPAFKNEAKGCIKFLKRVKTEKTALVQKQEKSLDVSNIQPDIVLAVKSDVDELPLTKAKPNKNTYAIVIGIENYRQKLPKADFAVQDAKIVAEYLTRVLGYPEENVVTLLNDRASNVDMVKYFEKWLPNNVDPGATVFVYYSGHGAPNPRTSDAYLVPYDGDPSFIDETGYSLKRMYDALGKLPAKQIIVALDSCFSGAGGRSVLAKGARPIVLSVENPVLLSKKITILSASGGDQVSSTYDEKGHGLFTYFMLMGIKNGSVVKQDGSIDLASLFDYIKPQV